MPFGNFNSYLDMLLISAMQIIRGVEIVGWLLREEGIYIRDGPKIGSGSGVVTNIKVVWGGR